MKIIYFLLLCTVIVLCLDLYRKRFRKHRIPPQLVNDNDMINMGMIPSRLHGMIALEYEEREDYSMSSSINTIFVQGSFSPMWCLTVNLFANRMNTSFDIVYDHNGAIHQY